MKTYLSIVLLGTIWIALCLVFHIRYLNQNTIPKADMEAAIIYAYEIGKQECADDTTCIPHGQLNGLKRLTINDIQGLIE